MIYIDNIQKLQHFKSDCVVLLMSIFVDPDVFLRLTRLPLQVGSVTAICFTCFLIRCFVVSFQIFLHFIHIDIHIYI